MSKECRVDWCDENENICPYCGLCKSDHNIYEEGCSVNIKTELRNDFKYEKCLDEKLKTYVCKKCNSDKWIVGSGSYYTAIKCINCKYEIAIHEG